MCVQYEHTFKHLVAHDILIVKAMAIKIILFLCVKLNSPFYCTFFRNSIHIIISKRSQNILTVFATLLYELRRMRKSDRNDRVNK